MSDFWLAIVGPGKCNALAVATRTYRRGERVIALAAKQRDLVLSVNGDRLRAVLVMPEGSRVVEPPVLVSSEDIGGFGLGAMLLAERPDMDQFDSTLHAMFEVAQGYTLGVQDLTIVAVDADGQITERVIPVTEGARGQ